MKYIEIMVVKYKHVSNFIKECFNTLYLLKILNWSIRFLTRIPVIIYILKTQIKPLTNGQIGLIITIVLNH